MSVKLSWGTKSRSYDMIDLQVTYDANVITAVRLVHDNRMIEVRFLWTSHFASGKSSQNNIVRDTYE